MCAIKLKWCRQTKNWWKCGVCLWCRLIWEKVPSEGNNRTICLSDNWNPISLRHIFFLENRWSHLAGSNCIEIRLFTIIFALPREILSLGKNNNILWVFVLYFVLHKIIILQEKLFQIVKCIGAEYKTNKRNWVLFAKIRPQFPFHTQMVQKHNIKVIIVKIKLLLSIDSSQKKNRVCWNART